MGERERVYLVEDSQEEAVEVLAALKNAGHNVIGYAKNFKVATECISEAIERGMTVAVVDGNLNHYPDDCEDGKAVAKLIKEQAPSATIIAYSRSRPGKADFGDIYINKDPEKLAQAVTAIPRNQK